MMQNSTTTTTTTENNNPNPCKKCYGKCKDILITSKIKCNNNPTCSAMMFGAILGALVSFLVAATLLEVSTNEFFAFYFGIVFIIVGLAIGYRVITSPDVQKIVRVALLFLAFIVFLGGISCFILDHKAKALGLSPISRIPFYLVLGIAVSFSVTFALVDCINLYRKSSTGMPVIENVKQVSLILTNACFTGIFYGLIFGLFDIEDTQNNNRRNGLHELLLDERVSLPIGIGFGLITGICVHRVGPSSHQHLPDVNAEQIFMTRMERAQRGSVNGYNNNNHHLGDDVNGGGDFGDDDNERTKLIGTW
jgi:hypothetical protein